MWYILCLGGAADGKFSLAKHAPDPRPLTSDGQAPESPVSLLIYCMSVMFCLTMSGSHDVFSDVKNVAILQWSSWALSPQTTL